MQIELAMRVFTLIITSFLFLFGLAVQAQKYTLSGTVTTSKLEPLALVSVQLQGTEQGTVTNSLGYYSLQLDEGEWILLVSMLGYKAEVIKLLVQGNTTQHIILEEQADESLSGVTISAKQRDRSVDIIKMVIAHKDSLLQASGAYSTNIYIKATQEGIKPPNEKKQKRKKQTETDSTSTQKPTNGFANMAMAEIVLQADVDGSRIKEERTGVARRGNPESLFFMSLTEADFNLYNNLLKSRVLSQIPFISPLSYAGLLAYKYKMLNMTKVNGIKTYTIQFSPKLISNATISGQLTITEGDWVIHTAKFTLPSYHLPEYDFFEVEQGYDFVDSTAWMINKQQFTYYSKLGKGKLSGSTTANYKGFELNKIFPKKHFGLEVSSTNMAAYKRDSSFWAQSRTEPLTSKEISFLRFKDSIQQVVTSKVYLDSLDSITNRITLPKLAWAGQQLYSREKQRTWSLPPVLSLIQPIGFGGVRISPWFGYRKIYANRKNFSLSFNGSYGLRNKDVNGSVNISRMYNPFNRGFYRASLSRDFSYIYEGDSWINMLNKRNMYLSQAFGVGHGVELVNGLYLFTDIELALRKTLSSYKTGSFVDSTFGSIITDNSAVNFAPYNALYSLVSLEYTPFQKFIREPLEKIIIGSKWPTVYTKWRHGYPNMFKSEANFDYLEFGMRQTINWGTYGIGKFKLLSGSFLNQRNLQLVDYKFQRRGDPFLFLNPEHSFQALDSTFPVFKRFYQGHYMHEFNGALLNKIPLLKKLQLREIAGGGFLIAPERNLRYAELYAGIERAIEIPFIPLTKFKLGIYVVGSAANQFQNPVSFKIGLTTWNRRLNKWQ